MGGLSWISPKRSPSIILCGEIILRLRKKQQMVLRIFLLQNLSYQVGNRMGALVDRFLLQHQAEEKYHFIVTGHEESYNPPVEYIPTQEEVNSYELMYEEDRPKFIPKGYGFV